MIVDAQLHCGTAKAKRVECRYTSFSVAACAIASCGHANAWYRQGMSPGELYYRSRSTVHPQIRSLQGKSLIIATAVSSSTYSTLLYHP